MYFIYIYIYLRCIACYFDIFIYCIMIASQAIFITLHHYSTILLSVFIILCISQDSYFEVGGSTLFITNYSQISIKESNY